MAFGAPKNSWSCQTLCYCLTCMMKGEQKSLLFRPRSIYPPCCDPQWLCREDATPCVVWESPNIGVFPKRGAALGRLQGSSCPFLVLWHHPVAAGKALSLPSHHVLSPCSPALRGPGDLGGSQNISDGLARPSRKEVSRSLLSPANWSFLVGWPMLGDAELPAGKSFTLLDGRCDTASRRLSKSLTILDVAVPELAVSSRESRSDPWESVSSPGTTAESTGFCLGLSLTGDRVGCFPPSITSELLLVTDELLFLSAAISHPLTVFLLCMVCKLLHGTTRWGLLALVVPRVPEGVLEGLCVELALLQGTGWVITVASGTTVADITVGFDPQRNLGVFWLRAGMTESCWGKALLCFLRRLTFPISAWTNSSLRWRRPGNFTAFCCC